MQRREFLAAALAAPIAPIAPALATDVERAWCAADGDDGVRISSPDGAVELLLQGDAAQLRFAVTCRRAAVIEPSPLSLLVDGVDLAQGATVGKVESYERNERFAWRGVHGQAVNRFKGASIALRHTASRTADTVEVRVFDGGSGCRRMRHGEGRRAPEEATARGRPGKTTGRARGTTGGVHGTTE